MTEPEDCARKAEAYMRQALQAEDLGERARLLALAAHWTNQGREAEAERDRERSQRRPTGR